MNFVSLGWLFFKVCKMIMGIKHGTYLLMQSRLLYLHCNDFSCTHWGFRSIWGKNYMQTVFKGACIEVQIQKQVTCKSLHAWCFSCIFMSCSLTLLWNVLDVQHTAVGRRRWLKDYCTAFTDFCSLLTEKITAVLHKTLREIISSYYAQLKVPCSFSGYLFWMSK